MAAPPAGAATLSDFHVSDEGERILFVVSTCTAGSAKLTFTALLRPAGSDGPSYPTRWNVRQPRGCQIWRLGVPDLYPKGDWSAQVRLVTGGHAYRTPSRPLTIR